jgi:hypothetical protein
MKVSTKIDTKGLRELRKQLKQHSVNVGYIDSPEHWMNEGDSVGEIARHLHYWSAWKDTFMLSETKKSQVADIVRDEIRFLPNMSVAQWTRRIGQQAASQIEENILTVQIPRNSIGWQQIKGFNDPLAFGSVVGQEPNLVSEITFKVGNV